MFPVHIVSYLIVSTFENRYSYDTRGFDNAKGTVLVSFGEKHYFYQCGSMLREREARI